MTEQIDSIYLLLSINPKLGKDCWEPFMACESLDQAVKYVNETDSKRRSSEIEWSDANERVRGGRVVKYGRWHQESWFFPGTSEYAQVQIRKIKLFKPEPTAEGGEE